MVDKIKIARETSVKVSNGEFVICARTDAKGVIGLETTGCDALIEVLLLLLPLDNSAPMSFTHWIYDSVGF